MSGIKAIDTAPRLLPQSTAARLVGRCRAQISALVTSGKIKSYKMQGDDLTVFVDLYEIRDRLGKKKKENDHESIKRID